MKIDTSFRQSVHIRRLSFLLTAAFTISFLLAASVCPAEETAYKTLPLGDKAPTFKTTTIEGQPFDLQECFSKKGVVLFFWSLFCSPCREEMPYIQKISQQIKDSPVEIIGVNLDEPPLHNAVRSFLKTSGFTYTMIVNKTTSSDSQSDKLYMITGTPVLYIIKQGGSIAFAHVGRLEPENLEKVIKENLLGSGI